MLFINISFEVQMDCTCEILMMSYQINNNECAICLLSVAHWILKDK